MDAPGWGELIDCRDHHAGFNCDRWHRKAPPPPTQPTWRQLIRLLLTLCCGAPPDLEGIRSYQQDRWGMRADRDRDETCVIELCSLASPSLRTKRNIEFDPTRSLGERIQTIRSRIAENKPKVVVMYGATQLFHFRDLAGSDLAPDQPTNIGQTCFVHTPAPTKRGLTNAYWVELGKRILPCLK